MSTDALITLSGPTMGTRWTAKFRPPGDTSALEADLAATIARVDQQMSNWRPDSDLMRLNAAPLAQWVSLPADLMHVLDTALRIGRASDWHFDIGVGGLVKAWGFGPAQGTAAPAAMAAHLGRNLGTETALQLDPATCRARKTAAIDLDLSGIAKGFGVDQLAKTLRQHGVRDFLVGLDGEITASGLRPDGKPWAVALESPTPGLRAARGVIEVTDQSIATSGDYRHFIDVGALRVSHTMNPRRGGPATNAVASVTVFAPTCMQADAWATVLMVLGEEAGPSFARARGIHAIFLVREGEGLREILTAG